MTMLTPGVGNGIDPGPEPQSDASQGAPRSFGAEIHESRSRRPGPRGGVARGASKTALPVIFFGVVEKVIHHARLEGAATGGRREQGLTVVVCGGLSDEVGCHEAGQRMESRGKEKKSTTSESRRKERDRRGPR